MPAFPYESCFQRVDQLVRPLHGSEPPANKPDDKNINWTGFESAVELDHEFSHCGSESNFGGYDLVSPSEVVLNLRVVDIKGCYELWRSRGARFITEPKVHETGMRCNMRDPDR